MSEPLPCASERRVRDGAGQVGQVDQLLHPRTGVNAEEGLQRGSPVWPHHNLALTVLTVTAGHPQQVLQETLTHSQTVPAVILNTHTHTLMYNRKRNSKP